MVLIASNFLGDVSRMHPFASDTFVDNVITFADWDSKITV